MSTKKKKKAGRPKGAVTKTEAQKRKKIGGTVAPDVRVFVTVFCRKTSRSTSSILQEALEDFMRKQKRGESHA